MGIWIIYIKYLSKITNYIKIYYLPDFSSNFTWKIYGQIDPKNEISFLNLGETLVKIVQRQKKHVLHEQKNIYLVGKKWIELYKKRSKREREKKKKTAKDQRRRISNPNIKLNIKNPFHIRVLKLILSLLPPHICPQLICELVKP